MSAINATNALIHAYKKVFLSAAPTTLSSIADGVDPEVRARILEKLQAEDRPAYLMLQVKQIPKFMDLLWRVFALKYGVDSHTLPLTEERQRMLTDRILENVTNGDAANNDTTSTGDAVKKCIRVFVLIRKSTLYVEALSDAPIHIATSMRYDEMLTAHKEIGEHCKVIINHIIR
jgi:hypothetical protein